MKKIIILLIVSGFYLGCSATKSNGPLASSKTLDRLIEQRAFDIVYDWAEPQMTRGMNAVQNSGLLPIGSSAGLIRLTGSTPYLRMHRDTLSADLPYYGEQRIASRYTNNEMGIAFEGVPEDLSLRKGKKSSYLITFSINGKYKTSENYTVTLKLFNNLTSTLSINSSHRTAISYTGRVKALDTIRYPYKQE